MDGHVVVACKHVDRSIRHLYVDVGVPGHDLNDTVRRCFVLILIWEKPTLRFHHQPRSVPCMIHVSAPRSDIEERYDCMRRERLAFCSS